jgi:hypothetical protein
MLCYVSGGKFQPLERFRVAWEIQTAYANQKDIFRINTGMQYR